MLTLAAIRNLSRNRRRTAAVLVTVALGVCGLFVFDGFLTGTMNQYRDEAIHGFYGHGQLNARGYLDKVWDKPWERWIDDYDAMAPELARMPGVTRLFPRVSFPALLQCGDTNVSGLGIGVDAPAESAFFRYNMASGKDLTDEPDGVVIGVGLARSLNVKIGDRVTVLGNSTSGALDGVDLRLVGVFHQGGMMDNLMFRLPLEQARRLLGTRKVESVSVGLRAEEDWAPFRAAAEQRWPALEAVPFAKLDEVYFQHALDWLDAQFKFFLLVLITVIVLGILNAISTSVLERRQEIGNLRANGESALDVMRLLLSEGVAVGALGSVLGVAFAWLLVATVLAQGVPMPPGPGLTREFFIRIELQPPFALVSVLLGIGCTAFGTLLAGLRVTRLKIGEALRSC